MPAVPVMLRTSERSSFKTCRQQWWWGYEERLSSTRLRSPLAFGSLIHGALQIWYKPGKKRHKTHPAKLVVKVYEGMVEEYGQELPPIYEDETGKRIDALDLAVHMLQNYVDEYGQDERYEVVAPEQAFQIDVHHPETDKYLFTYVGEMDAVVRDLQWDRIGLMEHKTGASLEPFGAPVTLDEQSSAYWTFGTMYLKAKGVIPIDQDLDFILYNRLRKAFKDDRPRNAEGLCLNKDGSVSKKQPNPLFKREYSMRSPDDRVIIMQRAISEAREMRLVRQGKLDVYKNPGRHCGFCQFRDMCEVHETGSDWEAIRDTQFVKWEPYEVHAGMEEV